MRCGKSRASIDDLDIPQLTVCMCSNQSRRPAWLDGDAAPFLVAIAVERDDLIQSESAPVIFTAVLTRPEYLAMMLNIRPAPRLERMSVDRGFAG